MENSLEDSEERKTETGNSQSSVQMNQIEIGSESVNPGASKPLKIDNETETREQLVLKIFREFFLHHGKSKAEKEEEEKSREKMEEERIQIDLQNDGETATAKALKNPLVVKIIIRNLDVASLLSCRLVNILWLALCTELLSKSRDENKNALRIAFHYCKKAGSYIKYFDGILRGEIKTLESFNGFLEKLAETATFRSFSLFPCTNFAFQDLDLSRLEIQRFFGLQGSQIKGLDFAFIEKDATPESFTDLLMNKAPNVECLTISRIPVFWRLAIQQPIPRQILNINPNKNLQKDKTQNPNTSADLPLFSLGKLQCLQFSAMGLQILDGTLVKEIVLASPALKTILVHDEPLFNADFDFDYLTSISKGHLITHVNLTPKARNLEILNNFAQSKGQGQSQGQGQGQGQGQRPRPRLTHLNLSLRFVDSMRASNVERSISFDRFVPLAFALLESSKESLEYFSMSMGKRVTQFLQLDDFPILKNVKVVGFYCREHRRQVESPIPAKQFKRIFPNAWKLWLSGEYGGEGAGTGILIFPAPAMAIGTTEILETEVIPQITDLSLCSRFTRQFLNNIPLIFCNVVQLFIRNINLLPVLPLIWRFGYTSLRLKVLDLEISMDQNPDPNFLYEEPPAGVDAFLFTYPVLNFPQLDAVITGFPEEACVQLLSIYPEIPDDELVEEIRINPSILDLKYLEELRIKFEIIREAELPENILTVVSGAYAFERMKSKLGQKLGVHIEAKLDPVYNQRPSELILKKQRAEKILKPLLPYAKVSFTIDKR